MIYATDEFNYTIRLDKGESIRAVLTDFVREKQLRGAWVVGLGGLSYAELGMYDLSKKDYQMTRIQGPLELVSLTGTIAWQDDAPAIHLHGSVSDETLRVMGGHFKDGSVSGTVELFIHVWDTDKGFSRSLDEETGLNLLQP